MGYWNQTADGASLQPEPTGLIWGDRPADIFENAVDEVEQAFVADLGRKPTKAEIKAGLKFVLGGRDYEEG